MNADPLERLLDKLSAGDPAAAELAFRTCEPYLRMVVRRQLPARLRAKFDSWDVVQSAWADVLRGLGEADWRFTDTAHLRAFLVKITRNRFIDLMRKHRHGLRAEHSLSPKQHPPSREPRPSEEAQARELWAQLLAQCPKQHRPILELKRQGKSLEEIASDTGLHSSSVRRILYELAKQISARLVQLDTKVGPP